MDEGYFDDAAEDGGEDDDEQPERGEGEEDDAQAQDGNEDGEGGGAGEGSGSEAADSSEEEEGPDEYEKDDFLVEEGDDEEEEGGEEEREKRRRRKRRREREEEQLGEDDYALLEDAGVRVERPRQAQHKRIKKRSEAEAAADKPLGRDQLHENLFGPADDDDGLEEDLEDRALRQADYGEEEFEEGLEDDEMGDFIDDDTGEPGEPRRRRMRRPSGAPAGVSVAALQEARDIFGDNIEDLLEDFAMRRGAGASETGNASADEAVGDELDDELDVQDRHTEQEARRRQRKLKRVARAVEPEVLARHMLLPSDDIIRSTDLPERLQGPANLSPEHFDIDACATWVVSYLMGDMRHRFPKEVELIEQGIKEIDGTPQNEADDDLEGGDAGDLDLSPGFRGVRRRRDRHGVRRFWDREADAAQGRIHAAVKNALTLMFTKHREVPFIACFCKEEVAELLLLDRADRPDTTSYADFLDRKDHKLPVFPEGSVQSRHRVPHRWDVLWAVYSLGVRYRALARRKELRRRAYDAALDKADGPERKGINDCIDELEEVQTSEALDDLDAQFRLLVDGTVAGELGQLSITQSATHRPSRTSAYSIAKKAGMAEVVAKLNITAAELGENLLATYKKNDPEDDRATPTEVAEILVDGTPGKESPEEVLAAARSMAVTDLAADYKVKAWLRQQVEQLMQVSTDPTEAGESQLDPFHQLGTVKRLRKKPFPSFSRSDAFVKIHQAEAEGLLTVSLLVEEKPLLEVLREKYFSTGLSDASKEWNAFRDSILHDLVARLLPTMKTEARARLLADGRDYVARTCGSELWKLLQAGPMRIKYSDSDEYVESRRFVGACWGPGQPATCLALVDESGALVDMMYAGSFSGEPRRGGGGDRDRDGGPGGYKVLEDPEKKKDAEKILEFLVKHTPHAVLVGTTNIHARTLCADLASIRDHILENQPQVLTRSDTGDMAVRLVNETIPAVWATCDLAKEELSAHLDIARKAVAIARMALEPLAVASAVCHPTCKNALSLPLHPLQSTLPQELFLAALHQTLITLVNQVGVEVNALVGSLWKGAQLPFVCGLGPRKGAALSRALQQKRGVGARKELWESRLIPNTVFRNCAPFLRVTPSEDVVDYLDPLDDMRISTSSYPLAMCLARAALGHSPAVRDDDSAEGAQDDTDEDLQVVERALKERHKVEGIRLADLNAEVMRNANLGKDGSKLSTLIDLAMEFVHPYMELRRDPEPLKAEDEFWACTGETDKTLKEGRLVEARVMWVAPGQAMCQLPEFGGLEAILLSSDISTSAPNVNARDVLQRGATVPARIKSVDARDAKVHLTTRSSDLNNEADWEEKYCGDVDHGGDEHYHVKSEAEKREERAKALKEERAKRNREFPHRPIRHPNFKNISMMAATEEVKDGDVGTCILRPSPKGPNELCMTLKLHDGMQGPMIQHLDIREEGKGDKPGIGAHLQLGKPLRVGLKSSEHEAYEDLDHLIAGFADQYVHSFKQLLKHRKFKEGTNEQVIDALNRERVRNRGQVVYCLGLKLDTPGTGYICFIRPTPTGTPHKEYFQMSRNGVYFRSKNRSIEEMLLEFKKSPTDVERNRAAEDLGYKPPPVQQQYGSGRPGAPSVPPANGHGIPATMRTGHAPMPLAAYQPPPPPQTPVHTANNNTANPGNVGPTRADWPTPQGAFPRPPSGGSSAPGSGWGASRSQQQPQGGYGSPPGVPRNPPGNTWPSGQPVGGPRPPGSGWGQRL
ncbi:hypothetical protein WJX73_001549 [Symbiochloris irregularis]|uniref:S1 motif domain-containing protein n=1 Tax=Symbiochloris irregularis TaxID=706552 RepID=A0AAW1PB03_9CHLO